MRTRAPKQARELAALYGIDGDDDVVTANVGNVDDTMLGIGKGVFVPSEEGGCVSSAGKVGTMDSISNDSSELGCTLGGIEAALGVGEGFFVPSEDGVCVSINEVGTMVGIPVDSSPRLGCKLG